jgi:hypothetical protein
LLWLAVLGCFHLLSLLDVSASSIAFAAKLDDVGVVDQSVDCGVPRERWVQLHPDRRLLPIAVHHGGSDRAFQQIKLDAIGIDLTLRFPDAPEQTHPVTVAVLAFAPSVCSRHRGRSRVSGSA